MNTIKIGDKMFEDTVFNRTLIKTAQEDACRKFAQWLESQNYLSHIVLDEDEIMDGFIIYRERKESLNADDVLAEYRNTIKEQR